ncbi:nucleoside-diphosphate-sugar epimerase [Granulicella arctica]|uniref:Nucleoside-diphosphate-sugar epimerase n=1 Tax=Granulicella arctica TaxID=940613 RepID=A0A7Y9TT40_9BACT|nr:nucleoside-diphosphate-sugar epimerase [Granulicella arctica]
MNSKRILFTGTAVFLGSHLRDSLLNAGNHVIGIDNLSTGSDINLAHLSRENRFDFVQQDICQPFDVGPVDFVFNFASPASPVDYTRLGIGTLLVGSSKTLNTLEIAKKYCAGYFHASTSECYGDPEAHPQPETYWGNVNPVGPRSVYDEAKRFSEAAVMAFYRYHRVNTHLVRIFNMYGPGLQINDGRVISNFMAQVLWRTAYHLWRWLADTQFLLCVRFSRRHSCSVEFRGTLSSKYRQSRRMDDSRVRHRDPNGYRLRQKNYFYATSTR